MIGDDDFQNRFGGIQRLYGAETVARLRSSHVCVIGVGGVGSWTAEALARSGIGCLTLIDMDEVCISNINRQLPALTETVGRPKVSVLRDRIRGINPDCTIHAVEEFFTAVTDEKLLTSGFDYVVDAIDSLTNKALLLARCRTLSLSVVTLGGAGGRRDPTKIKLADLAFASHDRLLRAVRKLLRTEYDFPTDPSAPFGIRSVFSSELPVFPQPDGSVCAEPKSRGELRINCNSGLGSATFVTGAFGFAAAAQVVNDLSSGKRRAARPEPALSSE